MKRLRQAGFSAVEGIVVIVILVALIGVGVWVWQHNNATTSSQETSVPEAPMVDDTDGLDDADKALDESDLDAEAADNSDLDDQADF